MAIPFAPGGWLDAVRKAHGRYSDDTRTVGRLPEKRAEKRQRCEAKKIDAGLKRRQTERRNQEKAAERGGRGIANATPHGSGCVPVMVMLFARQFRAMRTDGCDQFGGCNFVTHFAMNARFALVDFDEKNAFTVFCRFEP
jgi:hypothetical protein